MNCRTFHKYIGAFADGELDVPLNLEALEHLNVCPDCAAKVAEVHGLKSSLQRIFGDFAAPVTIRDGVHAAISRLREPDPCPAAGVSSSTLRRRPRMGIADSLRRWFLPLSVTAMILLGAFYLIRLGPGSSTDLPDGLASAAKYVADVRARHALCVAGPPRFDPAVFPFPGAGPRLVADQLSGRLNRRAWVPDLSGSGFALFGADVCRIGGRPAGQAFYRSESSGKALSVFSTGPAPEIEPNRAPGALGVPYYASGAEGETTLVAWHEPEGTYSVCGSLPESEIVKTIGSRRTAKLRLSSGPILACAYHSVAP